MEPLCLKKLPENCAYFSVQSNGSTLVASAFPTNRKANGIVPVALRNGRSRKRDDVQARLKCDAAYLTHFEIIHFSLRIFVQH